MTVIGIDAHKNWHTLVAVDEVGKRFDVLTVEARAAGHQKIMAWLEQFDGVCGRGLPASAPSSGS